MDLAALVLACAPLVAPDTAHALIQVESGGNPFAIGVVGGELVRQPQNRAEAVATARALEEGGRNYSVGLAQINKKNFASYGLTIESAFEVCPNLTAMQGILSECFERANKTKPEQEALRNAFSCYYSGNFVAGHKLGYVGRVLAAWSSLRQRSEQSGARGAIRQPKSIPKGLTS